MEKIALPVVEVNLGFDGHVRLITQPGQTTSRKLQTMYLCPESFHQRAKTARIISLCHFSFKCMAELMRTIVLFFFFAGELITIKLFLQSPGA